MEKILSGLGHRVLIIIAMVGFLGGGISWAAVPHQTAPASTVDVPPFSAHAVPDPDREAQNAHLAALQGDVRTLQEKIDDLQSAMTLLTQEVIQLKKIETSYHQELGVYRLGDVLSNMATLRLLMDPRVWMGVIILLAAVLIWKFRFRPRRADDASVHQTTAQQPVPDEAHQYMSRVDSMAAKLNLAHTYIAMDDHDAARSILEEVMRMGNPQQQEEAQQLLNTVLT